MPSQAGRRKPSPESIQEPRCPLCGGSGELLHRDLTDRLYGVAGRWRLSRCANRDCGLAWLDPAPKELAAAYESYYTHAIRDDGSWRRRLYERLRSGYLATRFGYGGRNTEVWEKFGGNLLACLPHRCAAFDAGVMWLPAQPGGKLLEIGCGNGDLLERMAALGWQVQGIEPDSKSADIALARGLPVIVGELGDLDELDEQKFGPGAFDAIIMSHVIEHVADPVALLRACRRILKTDGRLVTLTPNLEALGRRWFGRDWLHLDPPRHLHLFTPESMLIACDQAGFVNASCQTTIRDANWTLGASLALRLKGRYRMGELSWLTRTAGLALLYLEWFYIWFDDRTGEELVVVARKG